MKLTGALYIDGYDAYTRFGVTVAQYGLGKLIQMAPLKAPKQTEWPEENGTEYDLSTPQLECKSVPIDFNLMNIDFAEDLFELLMDGSYHTFEFTELKKTYRLRLLSNGKFQSLIRLGVLSLTFSDDFPEIPQGSQEEVYANEIWQEGYELDDNSFAKFGIWVLQGTDSNIRKMANTKENLKVTLDSHSGAIYDDLKAYYKSKDVQLNLLINALSIEDFWKRYNALFAMLLKPETRILFYEDLIEEYECFYKNCSVSKFDLLQNGKVWCEFSVTLTFIADKHESGLVLSTEDDIPIILEDTPEEMRNGYILLGQNPYKLIKQKLNGKEN